MQIVSIRPPHVRKICGLPKCGYCWTLGGTREYDSRRFTTTKTLYVYTAKRNKIVTASNKNSMLMSKSRLYIPRLLMSKSRLEKHFATILLVKSALRAVSQSRTPWNSTLGSCCIRVAIQLSLPLPTFSFGDGRTFGFGVRCQYPCCADWLVKRDSCMLLPDNCSFYEHRVYISSSKCLQIERKFLYVPSK